MILDIGRPLKVTASTAKLQHVLNMAYRFHNALLPVVNLAQPVANTEKAADGDIILPWICILSNTTLCMLRLIIMFFCSV